MAVYPSSLGGLNYSPSSFDPTTGYVINSQAETAVVLTAAGQHRRDRQVQDPRRRRQRPRRQHLRLLAEGLARLRQRDRGQRRARQGRLEADRARAGPRRRDDDGLGARVRRWRRRRAACLRHATRATRSGASRPASRSRLRPRSTRRTARSTSRSRSAGPRPRRTAAPLPSYRSSPSRATPASHRRRRSALRDPGRACSTHLPKYYAAGAQPHTVELQLVSSLNSARCEATLDGTSHGTTTVKVPEGWKVYVTFANHAAGCPDGLAVVDRPGSTTVAVRRRHRPPSRLPGGGVAYFEFTASKQGKYIIASTESCPRPRRRMDPLRRRRDRISRRSSRPRTEHSQSSQGQVSVARPGSLGGAAGRARRVGRRRLGDCRSEQRRRDRRSSHPLR